MKHDECCFACIVHYHLDCFDWIGHFHRRHFMLLLLLSLWLLSLVVFTKSLITIGEQCGLRKIWMSCEKLKLLLLNEFWPSAKEEKLSNFNLQRHVYELLYGGIGLSNERFFGFSVNNEQTHPNMFYTYGVCVCVRQNIKFQTTTKKKTVNSNIILRSLSTWFLRF